MPLSLITEEFRVLGTQPDGDSVRFYPADPQAWATTRLRARVNPTPPAVSGSVLTRLADTHGRPVALAYAGTPADTGITAADLGAVQVDVSLLRRSVNRGCSRTGWCTRTFYAKLHVDLRAELACSPSPTGTRPPWTP